MKNKFLYTIGLLFILFAGSGCEEVIIEQPFTVGSKYTFRIDKEYTTGDGGITLKITNVSDSRCPSGVVCVWQGEILVKGELTENDSKSNFEIHSVLTNQQIQPEGYTIQIIDAKPYPRYGLETQPEDLRITLLITKN